MPDFVRVTDKRTDAEYTTTRAILDATPDLTEAKGDAVDASGAPLAPTYPKPRVKLGEKPTTAA